MPKRLTPEEKVAAYDKKNKYKTKYAADNYNVLYVRYRKDDLEINDKLSSVDNKAQYILNLIRADIERSKDESVAD